VWISDQVGVKGSVTFRTEDQAREFAEKMKERYGASVPKDMVTGPTEALTKDIPDPAARQA
jgi:deoxyribose-phosphate aldolase